MGVRELAEYYLGVAVENKDFGAGWDITIIDPTGKSESMVGLSSDISSIIDPDTGAMISGRAAHVSLRISSLIALGFSELPRGIASSTATPWRVTFDDINGVSHTFKIMSTDPDRAIGLINCQLEAWAVT